MLQFRTFIARYWLLIFLASLAVVVLVVEVSLQRRPVAGPQAATASAASPCAAAPSVDKTVTGSKTFMHLDTAEINGKALVFRDDLEHTVMMPSAPLLLEGWAVDLPNKRPGAGVVALVDDASPITGTIGGSRPDVATAFGLPALEDSGFAVLMPASVLWPGGHQISLLILNADCSAYYPFKNQLLVIVTR